MREVIEKEIVLIMHETSLLMHKYIIVSGLLFLSAAILFYNVFFVFLEINLANSICLFFFSFATAILLFTVLNAQTPD